MRRSVSSLALLLGTLCLVVATSTTKLHTPPQYGKSVKLSLDMTDYLIDMALDNVNDRLRFDVLTIDRQPFMTYIVLAKEKQLIKRSVALTNGACFVEPFETSFYKLDALLSSASFGGFVTAEGQDAEKWFIPTLPADLGPTSLGLTVRADNKQPITIDIVVDGELNVAKVASFSTAVVDDKEFFVDPEWKCTEESTNFKLDASLTRIVEAFFLRAPSKGLKFVPALKPLVSRAADAPQAPQWNPKFITSFNIKDQAYGLLSVKYYHDAVDMHTKVTVNAGFVNLFTFIWDFKTNKIIKRALPIVMGQCVIEDSTDTFLDVNAVLKNSATYEGLEDVNSISCQKWKFNVGEEPAILYVRAHDQFPVRVVLSYEGEPSILDVTGHSQGSFPRNTFVAPASWKCQPYPAPSAVASNDRTAPQYGSQVTWVGETTVSGFTMIYRSALDGVNSRSFFSVSMMGQTAMAMINLHKEKKVYQFTGKDCKVSQSEVPFFGLDDMLRMSEFKGVEACGADSCEHWVATMAGAQFYVRESDKALVRVVLQNQDLTIKEFATTVRDEDFVPPAQWNCPAAANGVIEGASFKTLFRSPLKEDRPRPRYGPKVTWTGVGYQMSVEMQYRNVLDGETGRTFFSLSGMGRIFKAFVSLHNQKKTFMYTGNQCRVIDSTTPFTGMDELFSIADFKGIEVIDGVNTEHWVAFMAGSEFWVRESDKAVVRMNLGGQMVYVREFQVGVAAASDFVVPSEWKCPSSLSVKNDRTPPQYGSQVSFVGETSVSGFPMQVKVACDGVNQRTVFSASVMGQSALATIAFYKEKKMYQYSGKDCKVSQLVSPFIGVDDMLRMSEFKGVEACGADSCELWSASMIGAQFYVRESDKVLVRAILTKLDLTIKEFATSVRDEDFAILPQWNCPAAVANGLVESKDFYSVVSAGLRVFVSNGDRTAPQYGSQVTLVGETSASGFPMQVKVACDGVNQRTVFSASVMGQTAMAAIAFYKEKKMYQYSGKDCKVDQLVSPFIGVDEMLRLSEFKGVEACGADSCELWSASMIGAQFYVRESDKVLVRVIFSGNMDLTIKEFATSVRDEDFAILPQWNCPAAVANGLVESKDFFSVVSAGLRVFVSNGDRTAPQYGSQVTLVGETSVSGFPMQVKVACDGVNQRTVFSASVMGQTAMAAIAFYKEKKMYQYSGKDCKVDQLVSPFIGVDEMLRLSEFKGVEACGADSCELWSASMIGAQFYVRESDKALVRVIFSGNMDLTIKEFATSVRDEDFAILPQWNCPAAVANGLVESKDFFSVVSAGLRVFVSNGDRTAPQYGSQVTWVGETTVSGFTMVYRSALDGVNSRSFFSVSMMGQTAMAMINLHKEKKVYQFTGKDCKVSQSEVPFFGLDDMLRMSEFKGVEACGADSCEHWVATMAGAQFYVRESDKALVRVVLQNQDLTIKEFATTVRDEDFVPPAQWNCPAAANGVIEGASFKTLFRSPLKEDRPRPRYGPKVTWSGVAYQMSVEMTFRTVLDGESGRTAFSISGMGRLFRASITFHNQKTSYSYSGNECRVVTTSTPFTGMDELFSIAEFKGIEVIDGVNTEHWVAFMAGSEFWVRESDKAVVRMNLGGQMVYVREFQVGVAAASDFVVPSEWKCPAPSALASNDRTAPQYGSQVTWVGETTVSGFTMIYRSALDGVNSRSMFAVTVMGQTAMAMINLHKEKKVYQFTGKDCKVSQSEVPFFGLDDMLRMSEFKGVEACGADSCEHWVATMAGAQFYVRESDKALVRVVLQNQDLTIKQFATSVRDEDFVPPAQWNCPASANSATKGLSMKDFFSQPVRLPDTFSFKRFFSQKAASRNDGSRTAPQYGVQVSFIGEMAGSTHEVALDGLNKRTKYIIKVGSDKMTATISLHNEHKNFVYTNMLDVARCYTMSVDTPFVGLDDLLRTAEFKGLETAQDVSLERWFVQSPLGSTFDFFVRESDKVPVRMTMNIPDSKETQTMVFKQFRAGAIADSEFVPAAEWQCSQIVDPLRSSASNFEVSLNMAALKVVGF